MSPVQGALKCVSCLRLLPGQTDPPPSLIQEPDGLTVPFSELHPPFKPPINHSPQEASGDQLSPH